MLDSSAVIPLSDSPTPRSLIESPFNSLSRSIETLTSSHVEGSAGGPERHRNRCTRCTEGRHQQHWCRQGLQWYPAVRSQKIGPVKSHNVNTYHGCTSERRVNAPSVLPSLWCGAALSQRRQGTHFFGSLGCLVASARKGLHWVAQFCFTKKKECMPIRVVRATVIC